jgi:hypothetical protein
MIKDLKPKFEIATGVTVTMTKFLRLLVLHQLGVMRLLPEPMISG